MNPLRLPHTVDWMTAAPLWPGAPPATLRQPALVRLSGDDFMQQLLGRLSERPDAIREWLATGDSASHRERLPGEALTATPRTAHLKLYQPAHGEFNLVLANLVCALPGMPDHVVDPGHGEQVGFVLRRLDERGDELALCNDPTTGRRSWRPIKAGVVLMPGEELVPMFPLVYQTPARRRLWGGVIPVARQEELQSAPIAQGDSGASDDGAPATPIADDDALEAVKNRVSHAIELLRSTPLPGTPAIEKETSRFVILDLADFLAVHLPAAWQAVYQGTAAPASAKTLVDLLRARKLQGVSGATFAQAMHVAWDQRLKITAGEPSTLDGNLRYADADFPAALASALASAATAAGGGPGTTPPITSRPAATYYTVRCVYRRPGCGPLKPDRLSPPSEPFLLAPFLDPDAPTRPVRISLPLDTSIAGLRRFRKNVQFSLSASLREKLKQAGTLKDSEVSSSNEFDCGGLSLSIPIITICALIILMIFLNLLNIVFWWLPFVKLCLPKLKVE